MTKFRLRSSGERHHGDNKSRCDVLLVLTRLDPGGTLEVLILLIRELQALGLHVAVVALYRGLDGNVGARGLNCEVLVDRKQLNVLGYVKAFIKLAHHVQNMRPAAVLSFMPAANVMGAISATLAGVRCRIACHHQIRMAQHVIVRAIDRVLGSLGVYSQIVAVSQSVRDSFAGYPNSYLNRLCVIPNAIRPVSQHVDRLTVRKSLGIAPEAFLFVAIGRLSFEKNLERTLGAIALVPNVQIVLVGDGPDRSDVEVCIASLNLDRRVVLTGHVDHQTAVDILFASDAFIQLSLFEGRSLALLEALSARKAIIASDIAAQREVLTMPDGSLAGIVVDPEDAHAITAAISTIANNEHLRSQLVVSAATLAKQMESVRMGQEYVALLPGANRR